MRRFVNQIIGKIISLFNLKKRVFRITANKTGDEDREVMKVSYGFNQATDKEGQMTGIVRGGTINVRVKALNNGNTHLLRWMLASNMHKNGEIEFVETRDRKNMKTICREQSSKGRCSALR